MLLYNTLLGKLKLCLPHFCYTVNLGFLLLHISTSSESCHQAVEILKQSSSYETQRLYPNIQFGSQI
jgi:hypothetical protein